MSLKKKIIITIALGILIALGVYCFIEHLDYVIANFAYGAEGHPPYISIDFDIYYKALISHIIRLVYIATSSIIFALIIVFTWIKNK